MFGAWEMMEQRVGFPYLKFFTFIHDSLNMLSLVLFDCGTVT